MSKYHCSDAITIIKWMLSFAGVWPEDNPSLFYLAKLYFTLVCSIALFIVNFVETITIYNSYVDLAELLYIMMSVTSYNFKLLMFLTKRKLFMSILQDVDSVIFNFDCSARDPILKKTIGVTTIMARVYRVSTVCWLGFFVMFPILDNKPLPMRFSCDLGHYHVPMYIYQIIGMFIASWTNSTFDLLCAALMALTSVQMDTLRHRLSNLTSEVNFDEAIEYSVAERTKIDKKISGVLRSCVIHHLFIIKFTGKINELFSVAILVQFMAGILVVCNSFFQALVIVKPFTSSFFQLLIYLVVIIVELSCYCWFGNEVIFKSSKITDACYESGWYNLNTSHRKALLLIMERAKRPIAITAYKFTVASLATLMTIFRWAYSVFTLMRTMYSKDSM